MNNRRFSGLLDSLHDVCDRAHIAVQDEDDAHIGLQTVRKSRLILDRRNHRRVLDRLDKFFLHFPHHDIQKDREHDIRRNRSLLSAAFSLSPCVIIDYLYFIMPLCILQHFMPDLPRFFVTIRYSTPDSERFTPYEMLRNLSMSKLLVRFPDHLALSATSGTRTRDLLTTNEVRYHLCQSSIFLASEELRQ